MRLRPPYSGSPLSMSDTFSAGLRCPPLLLLSSSAHACPVPLRGSYCRGCTGTPRPLRGPCAYAVTLRTGTEQRLDSGISGFWPCPAPAVTQMETARRGESCPSANSTHWRSAGEESRGTRPWRGASCRAVTSADRECQAVASLRSWSACRGGGRAPSGGVRAHAGRRLSLSVPPAVVPPSQEQGPPRCGARRRSARESPQGRGEPSVGGASPWWRLSHVGACVNDVTPRRGDSVISSHMV